MACQPEQHIPAPLLEPATTIAAVRLRPGMYLGDNGPRGLHAAVCELLDYLIQAAQPAPDRTISLQLRPAGSLHTTSTSLALALGVRPQPDELLIPDLDLVRALHAPGLILLRAVAERLLVEVETTAAAWGQEYRRGVQGEVTPIRPSGRPGARFTFWPDPAVFAQGHAFDDEALAEALPLRAAANRAVRLSLTDDRRRPATPVTFHFPGGVADLLRHWRADAPLWHPEVCHVRATDGAVELEAALGWVSGPGWVRGLVGVSRVDVGTHVAGLRAGCARPVLDWIQAQGLDEGGSAFTPDDLTAGLAAVVLVRVPGPLFQGPTRDNLANPEVAPVVRDRTARAVRAFLANHPDAATRVAERARAARTARTGSRAARRN